GPTTCTWMKHRSKYWTKTKGQTHRGYYWVFQNSLDKIFLFDYQEWRGREGPLELLKSFQGYLKTDGYSAYEIFDKRPGINK
ncbi:MAG: transposase, partial [Segetibacter sp.]